VSFLRDLKRANTIRRKRRKLQLTFDEVYDKFEKDIADTKDYQKQRDLQAIQQFECGEYGDEIQRIDSLEIIRRAERCYIDVADLPLPQNVKHAWVQGNHGTWYLHPKIFRELAKLVEAAEHERSKRAIERRDFWLKIFTATVAAIAAVASMINLMRK